MTENGTFRLANSKHRLMAKIRSGVSVHEAVDEWFRDEFYEMNVESTISREMEMGSRAEMKDLLKWHDELAAVKIGKEMLKAGAIKSIRDNGGIYGTRTLYSVVVMFRPEFSRDNKTGELKYLGGEWV